MAGPSTEEKGKVAPPFGKIALILAALIAAAAIGITAMRNRTETPPASPTATAPVGDVSTMIAQLEARLQAETPAVAPTPSPNQH